MLATTYQITQYQAEHHSLSHSMCPHQDHSTVTELKDQIYNCEQTYGMGETLRFW
jgi:hypothetical protein